MTKGRNAYYLIETYFDKDKQPLQFIPDDFTLDEDYFIQSTQSDVEVLFFGSEVVYFPDEYGKRIPFNVTVAFCREKSTGKVLDVDPKQLHFEKE